MIEAFPRARQRPNEVYGSFLIFYGGLMYMAVQGRLPVFEFETQYSYDDNMVFIQWLRDNIWIPMALIPLYLVTIFGIKGIMEEKEAFDLRKPLAMWSFALGIFSVIGSLRVVPPVYNLLMEKGWHHTVCGDTRLEWLPHNPCALWFSAFVLSKVPELVDTVFIVLRKKKLIFLHWYHHCATLIYAWHTWATLSLTGVGFAAMNFTVHALMYNFYGLTALGMRPKKFAQWITALQIIQMVGGTAICAYAFFEKVRTQDDMFSLELLNRTMDIEIDQGTLLDESSSCKPNTFNTWVGFAMYLSYLYLFVAFFQKAYFKPKKKIN